MSSRRRGSSPARGGRASPKRAASPARSAARRSTSGSPSARDSDARVKLRAKQAVIEFLIGTGETSDFAESVVALMETKNSLLGAYNKAEDDLRIAAAAAEVAGAAGNSTISQPGLTRQSSEEDIVRIFRKLDSDGNGIIERVDLCSVLRKLDPAEWTDDELDKLMDVVDTNKDGRIQYEEFVTWACSSTFAPFKSMLKSTLAIDRVEAPRVEAPPVNVSVIEEACRDAKLQLFGKLMDLFLPGWLLEECWASLKTDVVGKTLQPHLTPELFKLFEEHDLNSPLVARLWRDTLVKVVNNTEMWTCPVCVNPLIEVPEYDVSYSRGFWKAPLRRTEHWSNFPCGHGYCMDCMKTWVESEINSVKVNIKCLAPGCKYKLWDQDIQSIVSSEIFDRYKEYKAADYAKRLATDVKADPALKKWLEENARPCPDCHAIISRSAGCNVMTCTCGTKFCYACGFKWDPKCKCGIAKDKRGDIWSVDEAKGS